MSEHEEHERLANELEQQTDRLQAHSDELGGEISDVRQDWERKRKDEGVPGAVPPSEESDGPSAKPEGEPAANSDGGA